MGRLNTIGLGPNSLSLDGNATPGSHPVPAYLLPAIRLVRIVENIRLIVSICSHGLSAAPLRIERQIDSSR